MRDKQAEGQTHQTFQNGAIHSQPLLTALLQTAQLRRHSFKALAHELDVSYERLSQWRRRPQDIAHAGEAVYESAAHYLGLPVALTMAMGGKLVLTHLMWPSTETLAERLSSELAGIRQDPYLGGFLPNELESSPQSVQLFVVFLVTQLRSKGVGHAWTAALQKALQGHSHETLGLF
jgi:hypothetical protein